MKRSPQSRVRAALSWLFSGALLLATPGCTSKEEKAVLLVESIADAFEKNGKDCDALAARLDKLMKGDPEALAALVESDANPSAQKRLMPFRGRIDKAVDRIVGHAEACGGDARVAAVMEQVL